MTTSLFANIRRYLALYLPWLPAERLVRNGGVPADRPFALVEKQGGAMRIAALNRKAVELRLEAGQPLADARGYLPDLATFPHDPQADAAFLDRLSRFCDAYTPSVQLDPPRGIVLDITGCAHLHGGEAGLQESLSATIAGKGLTVCSAVAGTAAAARALARFGGTSVESLPLAALEVDAETRHALSRAGFRRIGDLAALPRRVLAARFGVASITQLARLLAEEDAHIVPQPWQDAIFAEQRFAEPVGRTEDVLEVIELLLQEVGERLLERDQGGRRFVARLHRSDGHVARLDVETGAPTRDPSLVLRLLQERIDSLADPLDPGFGFDSIDLAVPHSETLLDRQQAFGETDDRPVEVGPLLDRLAVRHGASRVQRFAFGDSHIPERAGRPAAFDGAVPGAALWETGEDEPPLRPLLLLDPPQRVDMAGEEGALRHFTWKGGRHRIVRLEGPERIGAEWWRRRDGHRESRSTTRDYFRMEDEGGHRYWLFRRDLGDRNGRADWYLHGLFS